MRQRYQLLLLALLPAVITTATAIGQEVLQPEELKPPTASRDGDAGSSSQGDFKLRPLSEIEVTGIGPEGVVPFNLADEIFTRAMPWDPQTARDWNATRYHWRVPLSCSETNYFEQPVVERYGQCYCPALQPALSTAHFFGTAVVLPAEMAIFPPGKSSYTLGRFRAGSPTPVRLPGVR